MSVCLNGTVDNENLIGQKDEPPLTSNIQSRARPNVDSTCSNNKDV
jgi:hypothetical protein